MNKILVNTYSNIVEYIGVKADIVSNGIDVGEFIFGQEPNNPTVTVVEIDVPSGVIAQKYCYTADKGFYLNPAWVQPISDEVFTALKTQFTNLQAAFAAQLGV